MLFVISMLVVLTFLAVVTLWPKPDDAAQANSDKAGASDADGGKATPTTLEGALAEQLISKEITRDQYRIAVSRLAARDDERNPLTVPGDDRPEACA